MAALNREAFKVSFRCKNPFLSFIKIFFDAKCHEISVFRIDSKHFNHKTWKKHVMKKMSVNKIKKRLQKVR
jgi:hypothetical protein